MKKKLRKENKIIPYVFSKWDYYDIKQCSYAYVHSYYLETYCLYTEVYRQILFE